MLEKNVYSIAFRWNVLCLSGKFIWPNMLFTDDFFLLISCLNDLTIDLSGVLKSFTIIVLLSISFFRYVNICCICLGVPMLGAYKFTNTICYFWNLLSYVMFLLVSYYSLFFFFEKKTVLCDISIATPAFFRSAFAWSIFFHSFPFSCVSLHLK